MLEQLTEPLIDAKDRVSSFIYPQKPLTILRFDYEIDNYISKNDEQISEVEKFPDELVPLYYKCKNISCCSKSFLKRLISKHKIRFERDNFDLDLVYVTKRVIAMGYPAVGCESLFRNSLRDVKQFLFQDHGTNFKVFNLCLEPDRIYSKKIWDGAKVALFPFEDHQSCPVKLMLEFCVDMCLYLLDNEDHVGVVHCKAGKGRTGIMICAYLLFAGIATNTAQAFEFYGERRSVSKKGITVASQKRYLQHFETYLSCNFQEPYFKLIPKIIEKYLTPPDGNLLTHVFTDKGYYDYRNVFNIKKIKIGPFSSKTMIKCQILNFKSQSIFNTEDKFEKLKFKNIFKEEHEGNSDGNIYYFIIEISDNLFIDSDINIKIISKNINFNAWINLFYITLENFIYLISTEFKKNPSLFKGKFIRGKTLSQKKKSSGFSNNLHSYEMSDLSTFTTQNNKIKLNVELPVVKDEVEEKKKTFVRSYDANFFWEKKITLDQTDIKNFMKINTKYKGDHIHSYDLNNIYDFMNQQNSYLFDSKRKKFKIKMNSNGLDKFKNKHSMLPNFCIEITYYLDK